MQSDCTREAQSETHAADAHCKPPGNNRSKSQRALSPSVSNRQQRGAALNLLRDLPANSIAPASERYLASRLGQLYLTAVIREKLPATGRTLSGSRQPWRRELPRGTNAPRE